MQHRALTTCCDELIVVYLQVRNLNNFLHSSNNFERMLKKVYICCIRNFFSINVFVIYTDIASSKRGFVSKTCLFWCPALSDPIQPDLIFIVPQFLQFLWDAFFLDAYSLIKIYHFYEVAFQYLHMFGHLKNSDQKITPYKFAHLTISVTKSMYQKHINLFIVCVTVWFMVKRMAILLNQYLTLIMTT